MKVFLVDDSEILRERLLEILSEISGVEVVGQDGDPNHAIESILKLYPDVVIADIRMPGGSGIEVLQKVKRDNPRIKVIMFTNYPFPQYRRKCLAAGADFFFDKASEFDEVPRVLRQLILANPSLYS